MPIKASAKHSRADRMDTSSEIQSLLSNLWHDRCQSSTTLSRTDDGRDTKSGWKEVKYARSPILSCSVHIGSILLYNLPLISWPSQCCRCLACSLSVNPVGVSIRQRHHSSPSNPLNPLLRPTSTPTLPSNSTEIHKPMAAALGRPFMRWMRTGNVIRYLS